MQLRAVTGSVDVGAGETEALAVQALDVNGDGVDGARITFTRGARMGVTFEGSSDATDAITVKTVTSSAAGVMASGIAIAHIVVANSAPTGETSIVAVVKDPTDDAEAAVAARVQVKVSANASADAGVDAAVDHPADAAVPLDTGGAS